MAAWGLVGIFISRCVMPRETREFRFKIDCFTPETIPMARLAEYMADLADLSRDYQECPLCEA